MAAADIDAVRSEFRAWIAEHWDPGLSLLAWRRALVAAAWATPSWPESDLGRGLPPWADDVVRHELAAAGAPANPVGVGMMLAAPTILAHGDEGARRRFLEPIVTGAETWCQLFSEPGAGSDLAGLTTRAVRDGDEWLVTGQKVWNTSAHHADFGLLAARTDWDVPKHRGLTYFALPMHQAGVEVRPLRQRPRHGGGTGRALDEARRQAEEYFATYVWYPQRAGRVDLLDERARDTGRRADPVVRQAVAAVISRHRSSGWTAQRAEGTRALGRTPGAEGSIGKLGLSVVAKAAANAHSLIGGAHGMLAGPASPAEGMVAEKVLGLPREPSEVRHTPFRDLPRNG
jgi:hypothetical protein